MGPRNSVLGDGGRKKVINNFVTTNGVQLKVMLSLPMAATFPLPLSLKKIQNLFIGMMPMEYDKFRLFYHCCNLILVFSLTQG